MFAPKKKPVEIKILKAQDNKKEEKIVEQKADTEPIEQKKMSI
jgi:hypothetical protein